MTLALALLLFGLAFCGAFISGLVGVGGAVVMIPLLYYVPPLLGAGQLPIQEVAGLSMTQVLAAAIVGAWSHGRHALVHHRLAWFGGDNVEAVRRLQLRTWPGNIRELRNAVERALILASGKTITAADIDHLLPGPVAVGGPTGESGSQTFETFKLEAEKNFLRQKLKEHDWNVSETARSLKMPRSNLYKKIERYGLSRESV